MNDNQAQYYIGEIVEPFADRKMTYRQAHSAAKMTSSRYKICCVWNVFEPLFPEAIYVRGKRYIVDTGQES